MGDTKIGLAEGFIAELRASVRFETDQDIAVFAADAMRVYAELGRLCQGSGRLMWHPENGAPRRLRLPFEMATQQGGTSKPKGLDHGV